MTLLHQRFSPILTVLFVAGVASATSAAVLSIGHRGDSLHAPENTVAAFRSALGKADLVETDGRLTKDGVLVCMHDATVNRTTDGTGDVVNLTLQQIKLLDAGVKFSTNFIGERVPTLEEMVTNCLPQAIPLIEHKAGSAQDYLTLLQRLDVITNVVVQSFSWPFLTQLHALEPRIPLCALGSGTFTSTSLTNILNTGAQTVAWDSGGVDAAMLALAHSAGLRVFVWTVNGPAIKRFIDLGVDGIISDDPGSVRDFQAPVTNGPVALADQLFIHWRMDDGLANSMTTTVADSKSNIITSLTRLDGLSHWNGQTNAMFGGSIDLDGANAFIALPRTDINTNGFTFAAWLKLRDLPSTMSTSYGALLDSTNDCYVLYLDKANKELRFKVTDITKAAARPGIPQASLQTNQWIHVAATYDGNAGTFGGQTAIYLNGQVMDIHYGSDASPPTGLQQNVMTNQYAAIGREGPTGGNYFNGHLDDVAIWKRALNPTEVKALYDGGMLGQSLADLTSQPTDLLDLKNFEILSAQNSIEFDFFSAGPWTSFRLLRSTNLSGPYLPVSGLAPVSLGRSNYRFTCPLTNGARWFRVAAE